MSLRDDVSNYGGPFLVINGKTIIRANDYRYSGSNFGQCENGIFEAVRTVYGGRIRHKHVRQYHNGGLIDIPYLVVSNEFAALVDQYCRMGGYCGLSLQEYLMRAWRG